MLVSGQGRLRIHDRHPRDGLLNRPGLDEGIIPVSVLNEHYALVLLLLGDPGGALLGGLRLALEAEPLLLPEARELGLGDLGGRGSDAGRLARGGLGRRRRGSGDGGGLGLGEAAVLSLARRGLGALLGVLLPAARGAGLGALGLGPVLLLLGALLAVAPVGLRGGAALAGRLRLGVHAHLLRHRGRPPRAATGGAAWG